MRELKFHSSITACSATAIAAFRCASADLKESEIKMLARCIKLNNECAAMCLLAMESMARESEFVKQICKLCAAVCIDCAIECEKHAHMEHCKICAESCRICAKECLKMSVIL